MRLEVLNFSGDKALVHLDGILRQQAVLSELSSEMYIMHCRDSGEVLVAEQWTSILSNRQALLHK